MGYPIIKNKNGFSLIEIVVSISIFSIVFMILVNVLFYINKAEKDALLFYNTESGFQNVLNKMNTTIEENGLNYSYYQYYFTNPNNTIFLTTEDSESLIYRLNNKKIEFSDDGGSTFYSLNDSSVEVNSLSFYISKDYGNKISLVTIVINGKYIDQFKQSKTFNYQTTIEQKLYIK